MFFRAIQSICGVVDLPILGSNLVKIGVQGAIFDKIWWSFNRSASFRMWRVSGCLDIYEQNRKVLIDSAWATANDLEYLLLHEWSGCTSTLLHNCLLQCKYNDFSAILQRFCQILGMKSRKINFFSQRRTNTDKYGRGQFFMSYLCTVESERYGRVFPLATPTNYLRTPY